MLGRNALDQSYVTGYGTQFSQNQHHRTFAAQLDPTLPHPPAGTLSGGPNSSIQDPVAAQTWPQGCVAQRCYLDNIQSWSTNEMTVNWNSSLTWMAAWASSDEVVENGPAVVGLPIRLWMIDARGSGGAGVLVARWWSASSSSGGGGPDAPVLVPLRGPAPPGHRAAAADRGRAAWSSGSLVLDVVLGLLPVAFVLATSVVVGQVPAAVDGGTGSAAWSDLVRTFVLAAVLFLARQVLAPVQTALGVRMQRRIDGALRDRALRVALRSTSIAPMEDQATLEALTEATREFEAEFRSPGSSAAGLLALVARYVQLVGFAAVIGAVVSWPAAAAILVATLVFRYGQRGGLRRYSQVWKKVIGFRRRSVYLREVAMGPEAAKEMRVFGLAGWFTDEYSDATTAMLDPVAARRRQLYLVPYLVYTAIGLVISAAVLVSIARSASAGEITLTALALGIQSVVAAIALGEYYPESDVQTQYGMQAVAALARVRGADGRRRGAARRRRRRAARAAGRADGRRCGSRTCTSPTRAAAGPCSTASTWSCPRACAPRSSASTARARRRWSSC